MRRMTQNCHSTQDKGWLTNDGYDAVTSSSSSCQQTSMMMGVIVIVFFFIIFGLVWCDASIKIWSHVWYCQACIKGRGTMTRYSVRSTHLSGSRYLTLFNINAWFNLNIATMLNDKFCWGASELMSWLLKYYLFDLMHAQTRNGLVFKV